MTKGRRLLIGVAMAATLLVVYLCLAKPRLRIFYAPIGVIEDRRLRLYTENRRSGAAWTRNPAEVALFLVEGCNHEANAGVDCANSPRVGVFPRGTERITFVVLDDPVNGDDSIAAEEWRVDLVRAADGAWDLEWAGGRWRCGRERINFWTRVFPCS